MWFNQAYSAALDPTESRDVSGAHPERVSRMAADLEAWITEIEEDRRRP